MMYVVESHILIGFQITKRRGTKLGKKLGKVMIQVRGMPIDFTVVSHSGPQIYPR